MTADRACGRQEDAVIDARLSNSSLSAFSAPPRWAYRRGRRGRGERRVAAVPASLRQAALFGYNGARMIEVRNGSNEVDMQLYHGTQYIDELVGARLPDGYAVVNAPESVRRAGASLRRRGRRDRRNVLAY